MNPLERLAHRIESNEGLDGPAEALAKVIRRIAPTGAVKDGLSGTWLGHPLHPLLVTVPIGTWTGAIVLDLTQRRRGRDAARRMVGFGVASALPAMATGGSDWVDTKGAEKRVGFVHALSNYATVALFGASWLARRRGRHARGTLYALAGSGAMSLGGYLGGHLVEVMGVGVATTAFGGGPETWASTGVSASDLADGAPRKVDVGGVPVLLVSDGGQVRALEARCVHRGGPLHEGRIEGGCVECPWHGSRFRLADGEVVRGPATTQEPAYEVRTTSGTVEVRRDEVRFLRASVVDVGR